MSQRILSSDSSRPTDNPWLAPSERAAGLVLTASVLVALAWANAAGGSYANFWDTPVHWTVAGWSVVGDTSLRDLRALVDNGVMTVFFLVVGLEIGRERAGGSLRSLRDAALPVAAAVGGMVGAAAVCVIVAGASGAPLRGWGIPMATDVAFTLGALSLLGPRVPRPLRVLILTLAVADDVASIVVLGFVSSSRVDPADLGAAALVVLGTIVVRRRVSHAWWPYAGILVLLWILLARSGVEPAIAGAIIGVLIPGSAKGGAGERSPALRLEVAAVPISTYLVLPLFALANTGVALGAAAFVGAGSRSLLWSVVSARVLGKIVGITLAVALAVRGGFALPDGVRPGHIVGAAALCGIGFTVPLLFATSAFGTHGDWIATTRTALLAGSVLAFGIGATVLWVEGRRDPPPKSRPRPGHTGSVGDGR